VRTFILTIIINVARYSFCNLKAKIGKPSTEDNTCESNIALTVSQLVRGEFSDYRVMTRSKITLIVRFRDEILNPTQRFLKKRLILTDHQKNLKINLKTLNNLKK